MSNDLSQAVADVKQLGKLFGSVIALADAVEKVESISELEATRRRNVAALDAQIAEKQGAVQLLISQETEQAARLQEAINEAAANVTASADEAKRIIADASSQADGIINKASAEVAALEGKKESIKADIDTLTLAKNKVENEYVEVDGKLKAVKDELRAIAG